VGTDIGAIAADFGGVFVEVFVDVFDEGDFGFVGDVGVEVNFDFGAVCGFLFHDETDSFVAMGGEVGGISPEFLFGEVVGVVETNDEGGVNIIEGATETIGNQNIGDLGDFWAVLFEVRRED